MPESTKYTFENAWLEYKKIVLPEDLPKAAEKSIRKVFYAGAMAYYYVLCMVLTSSTFSEAEKASWVAEVNEELRKGLLPKPKEG